MSTTIETILNKSKKRLDKIHNLIQGSLNNETNNDEQIKKLLKQHKELMKNDKQDLKSVLATLSS